MKLHHSKLMDKKHGREVSELMKVILQQSAISNMIGDNYSQELKSRLHTQQIKLNSTFLPL